ncbi:amidohydrolase family protein [bacterium]|nr:amidohydrolase family protein [bacterium]
MRWSKDQGPDILNERGWRVTKTGKVLLLNAHLIDPGIDLDDTGSVLIERGKITGVGDIPKQEQEGADVIDMTGIIVCPGLFDMHVHLREPGQENKETIFTGTTAAAAGGFTAVACMPNTDPALDNVGVIRWIYDMAAGGPVDVHPIAAVTRNREGEILSDIADLYSAGVRALSDDGDPLRSSEVMRRALEYCKMNDLVISTHSEDKALASNGVMREGEASTKLGLAPWPSMAEAVMVARDVLLAGYTGGRLHVGHISSRESIEMVRWAKRQGYNVTCEATPHHFALNDEACASYSSHFKMNPPLGTEDDRLAVLDGLRDGTIDAIATDHAPHTVEEKLREFSLAPNGVIGLETAVGVAAKVLVEQNRFDWSMLIQRMAVAPRAIMRLPEAQLKKGAVANLSFIDTSQGWTVDPEAFFSKGRNTPFAGWDLPARPAGICNRGWMMTHPDVAGRWTR